MLKSTKETFDSGRQRFPVQYKDAEYVDNFDYDPSFPERPLVESFPADDVDDDRLQMQRERISLNAVIAGKRKEALRRLAASQARKQQLNATTSIPECYNPRCGPAIQLQAALGNIELARNDYPPLIFPVEPRPSISDEFEMPPGYVHKHGDEAAFNQSATKKTLSSFRNAALVTEGTYGLLSTVATLKENSPTQTSDNARPAEHLCCTAKTQLNDQYCAASQDIVLHDAAIQMSSATNSIRRPTKTSSILPQRCGLNGVKCGKERFVSSAVTLAEN